MQFQPIAVVRMLEKGKRVFCKIERFFFSLEIISKIYMSIVQSMSFYRNILFTFFFYVIAYLIRILKNYMYSCYYYSSIESSFLNIQK